jgi:hypothetical protein
MVFSGVVHILALNIFASNRVRSYFSSFPGPLFTTKPNDMEAEVCCDVPDVGEYEWCTTVWPLCARVDLIQYEYDVDARTVTRLGHAYDVDWISAPLDGTVRQLVADETHVGVMCEDGTVMMFQACTGDVLYNARISRHPPPLLAISAGGSVGVVRIRSQEDFMSATWESVMDVDLGEPSASIDYHRCFDAKVLDGRLYVLRKPSSGVREDVRGVTRPRVTSDMEIVVHGIDKRLLRIGTLRLPASKTNRVINLFVHDSNLFIVIRECRLWRVPLELCDL